MEALDDDNPLSRLPQSTLRQVLSFDPIKLSIDDHDYMMDEAHRREDFEFEESIDPEDEEDNEDDELHSSISKEEEITSNDDE